MSKDDGSCRLSSVFKPKERKPKKPHYIPRPWGKPYNYKCFQCPFTCMEKSHLYNHMKYSLCKNSLSLLIDNDWSYRKGATLNPDLRLLPARSRRSDEAGEVEGAAVTGGSAGAGACLQMGAGTGPSQRKAEGGGCSRALFLGLEPERNPPPEFLIADVISPKNPGGAGPGLAAPRGDSRVPLPGRGSKGSPEGRGPAVEQWKRAVTGPRRGAPDISPQNLDRPIIPCYPPPDYGDYREPQGHSLSVLGINYPLSHPGLFSYLGPSVVGRAVAHPHVAQLPFLASPAPGPFQAQPGLDRAALLPRFYYPLLLEQALGTPARKPETPAMPTATLPVKGPFALPKAGFLRVPTPKECALWPRSLHVLCCQPPGEEDPGVLGVLPPGGSATDQPVGATAFLSGELSRTLGAYQTVEKKLSDLANEDGPAQKPLREQLEEIRRELLRIHQALEQAAQPPEGPLDLSLKKEPPTGEEQAAGKLGGADPRVRGPGAGGRGREKTPEFLPQAGQAEGVPDFPLEIRQAVGPLCGHTTKCEADSSVLLCADGRAGPPGPPLSMHEEGSPGCRGVLCCGPGGGGPMGLPDP
ncbi:proline-rich protein 35 [Tachyglossus aculeatus]|uniref:proline-rich protein 35 n=1 Tax=Tachyglossus aculeatus TaxID=9261 RepID=UPI0018F705FD|nr:proline-rich protein 35 [Tachyglossus aculeatus]